MKRIYTSFDAAGIVGLKAGVSAQYLKCPQCPERTKHKNAKPLMVQHEKKFFHCYHCQFEGRIGDSEVERRIAKYAGFPMDQDWNKTVKSPYTKAFTDYWSGRGISERTLLRGRVYERQVLWNTDVGPVKTSVMHFPYYLDYELVNVKMRPIGDKDFDPKFRMVPKAEGSQTVFHGLDRIPIYDPQRPIPFVLVTEGESDWLSWLEVGVDYILTVPNGSQFGKQGSAADKGADREWAEYMLSKSLTALTTMRRHREGEEAPEDLLKSPAIVFVLAMDNDKAGIELRDYLAHRFGKHRCKVVYYGDCNDANQVLKDRGAEALRQCLENAAYYPLPVIVKASQVADRLVALHQSGYTPGWMSGITQIDYHMSYKRQQFSVWTGAPASGKSAVLSWLLPYYAKKNNIRIGLFCPEIAPVERAFAQIMESMMGKSIDPRHPNACDAMSLTKARMALDRWLWLFNPDMSDRIWRTQKQGREIKGGNLEVLLEIAAQETRRDGLDWLVIDPWNKLEHEPGRNQTMHGYTGDQLLMVDQFCKEYNTHVTIVAHPRKLQSKGGNYYKPSLYDISDSAHWNNMPRLGVVIERRLKDKDGLWLQQEPTKIHIEKVSFEEVGKCGTIEAYMDWYRGNHFVFNQTELDPRNSKGREAMIEKIRGQERDERQYVPVIMNTAEAASDDLIDYLDTPF